MPPVATKSGKSYFKHKGQSQSDKVIDHGFIWKDIISWVYMPNIKTSSYGSKVIVNVKADNRQTDKQTDKQSNKQKGQRQYAPIIRSGGIKRNTMSPSKSNGNTVLYGPTFLSSESIQLKFLPLKACPSVF